METLTPEIKNKFETLTASQVLIEVLIVLGSFFAAYLQTYMTTGVLIPDQFSQKLLGIDPMTPSYMGFIGISLITLPLVIRKQFPKTCLFLCLCMLCIVQIMAKDMTISIIPLLVALATVCSSKPINEAFVAGFSCIIIAVFLGLLGQRTILSNFFLFQNVALIAATAGLGIAFRTSRDLVASANLRTIETKKAARANTSKRLEEERVAIARELHDITAHSLSAISIQAAACEAQIDKEPSQAKETIALIRKISKDSLSEIRRMIGVLRDSSAEDVGADLAPSMGTSSLPEIEKYLEAAGVKCSIEFNNYEATNVPAYLDIAIFGLCREAATNIVRHASAENATIDIQIRDANELSSIKSSSDFDQVVVLSINDDGVGLPENFRQGDGHGVEGMGERVVALGGNFSINNASDAGGTVIYATFPLHAKKEK